MADAVHIRGANENRLTAAAAVASGEVWQLPDGRAAVYAGAVAAASGDRVNFTSEGQKTVTKTASQVWIDGAPIWWDHSANAATCVPPMQTGDRDFYLGVAVGDAASADTSGAVNLNVQPVYIIDSRRDAFVTAIVKTVVGSTTVEVPDVKTRGGANVMNFGTTAEAQKVDILSERSFPIAANWVVEGEVNVLVNSDNAAGDFDIGVASGTHATDFEAVAEFAAVHTDGNALDIKAHSDDGTTDVTLVDTTVDFAVGTAFSFTIDGRDHTNIKFYVNGVRVNSGTTFTLAAGTGPLKAIAHMEKTSDDSPGTYAINKLAVRIAEQ